MAGTKRTRRSRPLASGTGAAEEATLNQKVSALIEAFPPFGQFDRHGNITRKAGDLFDQRSLGDIAKPWKTAAQLMQERNHDTGTFSTLVNDGRPLTPNLFQNVHGKGWGLRATKEETYLKAGVEPFRDMSRSRIVAETEGTTVEPAASTDATQPPPSWEIPSEFDEIAATQRDWRALKEEANETGRKGEALVNRWLEQQKIAGKVREFKWVSQCLPEAPVDFVQVFNSEENQWIEVKSTTGPFRTKFFISCAELQVAAQDYCYLIYRVYEVAEGTAKLKVLMNFNAVAREILAVLKKLPAKVSLDDVMIDPSTPGIEVGSEINLQGA